MFGFGWLKSLPWSRAQRAARARREVEQVVERSSVLARAVEDQVRHQRLLDRHKAESTWLAAQKAAALLVADRRAVIAQMQAERRARSGTQLASLSFAPTPAAPRRTARDDSVPTAAPDTPALSPLHQHWGSAPVSSSSASSCHDSDSSSYDSGGSSDGGSCGGGD